MLLNFISINPDVVKDHSPEVDGVEGLVVAATEHLELLKQKYEVEGTFIIEHVVGKHFTLTLYRPGSGN